MNVRGLHNSQDDLKQALHTNNPDILVLTETKLYDSNHRKWLNKLMKDYKWWSSPNGTAGTLLGVRTSIAGLSQAKLVHKDEGGRILAVTLQSQTKNLILLGTYWPSGSGAEALTLWSNMETTVQSLIAEYQNYTPILLGDMNATYFDNDRSSSSVYKADRMYRAVVEKVSLQPVPENKFHSDSTSLLRPWTHLQSTASRDLAGNTVYTTGRIDDILLPQEIALKCPPAITCSNGCQSDHVPLVANIYYT